MSALILFNRHFPGRSASAATNERKNEKIYFEVFRMVVSVSVFALFTAIGGAQMRALPSEEQEVGSDDPAA